MFTQHSADLVEVDLAFADLQTFSVETFGVAKMQMRRMRAELGEAVGEVEAEMVGGKLGVRDIDAHPQAVPGAEGGRFDRGKSGNAFGRNPLPRRA